MWQQPEVEGCMVLSELGHRGYVFAWGRPQGRFWARCPVSNKPDLSYRDSRSYLQQCTQASYLGMYKSKPKMARCESIALCDAVV